MRLINQTVCILMLSLLIVGSTATLQKKCIVKKSPITLENVTSSCHDFTNLLFKTLSKSRNDNILISPVNLYVLLSLLTHGTGDSTLDELRSILYHNDIVSLSEEFKDLIALIKDFEHGELYTASAIFAQYGCPFINKFVSTSTDIFDSAIATVDFSDIFKAAEVINSWSKRSTYNKISNMITPDIIEEKAKTMLVNTMYFKGIWLHKFNKARIPREFYNSRRNSIFVSTMNKNEKFNVGEIPQWKANFIEIPYMNSDFVMVIVLPDEGVNLQTVEDNFDWKTLANAPRSVEQTNLYLPKFKIDFTIDLKDILKKMGVITMFSEHANFATMSRQPTHISHIIQKVFIEVDEDNYDLEGESMYSGIFTIERPFLFAIEYKPYKIPLLLGSVRKLEYQPLKDEL